VDLVVLAEMTGCARNRRFRYAHYIALFNDTRPGARKDDAVGRTTGTPPRRTLMSESHEPAAAAYPVTARNRAKRLHDRARYDHAIVHALLDAAALCHVAYVIDGQPFCTPTLFWREGSRLFWHGSSASRMLRNLQAGERACLTVTHLDSLVLARSGFNHSADYRSVMAFGTARLVEDPQEKARALVMMVDRLFPGRTAGLRPTTALELKATSVVWMDIEDASAKIRARGDVARLGGIAAPRATNRTMWPRRTDRSASPAAAVDLAAMPDPDHLDDDAFVVDRVDDPIHALPHPVELALTRELLAARGARIVPERFDSHEDAADFRLGDAAQILGHRRLDAQFIARHRPSASRGTTRSPSRAPSRASAPRPDPPGLRAATAATRR